jgi:membrane-associated phospholipid phosphatase
MRPTIPDVRRRLAAAADHPAARRLASRHPALARFLVDHLTTGQALLVPLLVGLVVVVTLGAGFAVVTDHVVDRDGVTALDAPVLELMQHWRSPGLTTGARLVTTLGSPPAVGLTALVAGAVLARRRRSWTPLVTMVVTWVGVSLISSATKEAVGRARPPIDDAVSGVTAAGDAFPSGHSSISMAVYAALAVAVTSQSSRRTRVVVALVALSAAVAVGLTRAYLGVHWATDVVASWALGLAWTGAVVAAVAAWRLAASWRRLERPSLEGRTA